MPKSKPMEEQDVFTAQPCPFCKSNSLEMAQQEMDIPYFGKAYVFSMTCTNCKFHKSDVETEQGSGPVKTSIEISGEEDMKIRIVKSAEATVKIPHIVTIEPGESSNGYVTNVEGLLNRVERQIETVRDSTDEDTERKKAKNMLKKISKVKWGSEKLTITIDDPSGNSAIISEKAVKK